ncbi:MULTISPECIES: diguanylate cyclase [Acinetobacter]|uniref:diguanylate cyclase n=1 Tax=Acinetobacter TaxID=469 RepID=UPI0009941EB9|nr:MULTISPECIES: diguanylate cyclase [Acinetobacter]MCL6245165.1 diguanylate cyclase [Acinetobacter amyesii]OOV83872.1 diguanylate cyclase [Acinetobacter sp. ANC 5600]
MNQECITGLSQTWKDICDQYTENEHLAALQFIQKHVEHLVTVFYEQMSREPASAEFFKDDIIQKRLIDTLRKWLLETFNVALNNDFEISVKRQQKVGMVHARVGIPSWLIMRGVREIERKIFEILELNHTQNILHMCSYIVQIIGFSTEIMCRSYEINTEKKQETKHNYRLFSAMQDVAVHKDKQRGSLLNWENELMFKIFSGNVSFYHSLLSKSEFGLWFIHKAAYAFSGSDQVQLIIDRIYQVDELTQQTTQITDKDQLQHLIQQIRDLNREIQHLVDQLFQVAEYIESGNDSLTQLLNRRYLSTIISREITFARQNKTPLSLLAFDADYFKMINDKFGHAAGDLALKFIAEALQRYSQGSDYAFRIGGEEFLLLLVDTNVNRAMKVAENIRQYIENGVIRTVQGQQFSLTVSVGCVQYNGHPDYQRLLDAADIALYAAKNTGRNRIYVAKTDQQTRSSSS